VAGWFLWTPISQELAAWRLERELQTLPIPEGWSGSDVQRVSSSDGPFLVTSYRVDGDAPAAVRRAVDELTHRGWALSGGAPDLSVAILRRDEFEVAIAPIGREVALVRVEIRFH
jgi:hypothetical protein